MSNRAQKILGMVSADLSCSKTSYDIMEEESGRKKERRSKSPKQRPKMAFSEDSIYSLEISLSEMEKIAQSNFEYENSSKHFDELDTSISKLKETLFNRPSLKGQRAPSVPELPQNNASDQHSDVVRAQVDNMDISVPDLPQNQDSDQNSDVVQHQLEVDMNTSMPELQSANELICHEELQPSPTPSTASTTISRDSFEENSDDSVKDKDYVPEHFPSTSSSLSTNEVQSAHTQQDIHRTNEEEHVTAMFDQQEVQEDDDRNKENRHGETSTKKKPRQRISKEKKKETKNKIKYDLKPPCPANCSHLCTMFITEPERRAIHDEYWSLNWEMRGMYVKDLVESSECANYKTKNPKRVRRCTNKYYFMNGVNKIEVCKTFFLCTLGYNKKNDRRILAAIKNPATEQFDKRDGRNLLVITVDKDLLTAHVNTFKPCVHHYRRKHAPNKKYLPSDLTITDMYANFKSLHPDIVCSIETYRKHVSGTMNISFAKLGHEECEVCEVFTLHDDEHVKEPDQNCQVCQKHSEHKLKYRKARNLYDLDVKKKLDDSTTVIVSADLQKVIMLPRIDTFKASLFCPRVVAYNESFVPLGDISRTQRAFAVLWHEGLSGRKQEDIISTFRAFLVNKRDAKTVKIWMDNCSSQNKNWCLFTFFVSIINSVEIDADTIELSYFEPGHTFMSADSFHHLVELSLSRMKKVYDFKDFVDAVEKSSVGKVDVKAMEVTDFFDFKDHASQAKLRKNVPRVYLKDIVQVMFKRGQYVFYYKTDLDSETYEELSFLKSKIIPLADPKRNPKGILNNRKKTLLKTLGPLMPANRQLFWKNIPTTNVPSPADDCNPFNTDSEEQVE